ncbi:Flagellar basal body rod protein FlgB [[Clostridium] ultunense Esp]|uniref:Flagellar basal body rod protein FlgB n=1 Tax=[Clostridium] ultunense Esp TaxID=1288971 RepID=M1ZFH4_9FIRM|nr:flagellar basal body rod protein FlgB [Schnuerera ultunensis]CCQ97481.1 Flagellar basal body rod protein FlgB [[Clostridium] ultunense Esp]SHD77006.1 Flagellar basal body rod protein FlgB [[Clostridium] ultunense Esp]
MFERLSTNIDMLNKALDGLWLRDKVINHNISNVNTPNYKKLTVNFEDKLKEAIGNNQSKLNRTHNKHLPISKGIDEVNPSISVDGNHSYRFDKNNVNIDTEMADLAKNTIMYNAVINQVIGEFDKIKNVINEGSK